MPLPPSVPSFVCSVVAVEAGPAVSFRGRIVSDGVFEGTYRLVVTKAGPSGHATVGQGGRFNTVAAAEVFVGSATVGVERGARYEARLTVEAGGRVQLCAANTGERT